eukprot:m.165229 g.165229  ORF g.165229 m.165229 type:complete len:70 (+) comp13435_c1_seq1:1901-2110(+)
MFTTKQGRFSCLLSLPTNMLSKHLIGSTLLHFNPQTKSTCSMLFQAFSAKLMVAEECFLYTQHSENKNL